MAYFAIHVKTGCERLVASHINTICRKYNRTEIKQVIVPIKTIVDLTGREIKQSIKVKLDSYVFVSVDSTSEVDYDEMTGTVYQLLKNSSPHIRHILPHSLLKEEYETFLDSTNITEVEIILTTPQETTHKPQKNYKAFIHNKFQQMKIGFNKYIQLLLKKRGISFQVDNDNWTLRSDSKAMMDLFSDTTSSIQDLMRNPLRTLLEIVEGYDQPISNSC